MPHKVTSGGKSRGKTNVERARHYLSSGGVARDDSDDELGLEDHPWEWVYTESAPGVEEKDQRRRKNKECVATVQDPQRIIGARMGTFECRLGDCVFLKAEGASNEAWIGIISNFEEDEEDEQKCANFMWFSTEKEIRNKQRKRTDAMQVRSPAFFYAFLGEGGSGGGSPLSSVMLGFEHALKRKRLILSYIDYVNLFAFADSTKQNEVYITPSWDINPLVSINGKASIVSRASFYAKYPSGKIPRSSKDYGKLFVCRRGCNTRTATYTDEFVWENIYRGYDDLDPLVERLESQTKATRKRKRDQSYNDDGAGIEVLPNQGRPKLSS